jgi:hypothetical protein
MTQALLGPQPQLVESSEVAAGPECLVPFSAFLTAIGDTNGFRSNTGNSRGKAA